MNFAQGLLHLTQTKTDRSRQVSFTDDVRAVLSPLATGREDGAILFINSVGTPYMQPRQAFQAAFRRTGIKDCRFHDLRPTYASDMVMAGVDVFTVSKMLGHSNVRTTMIYGHLSPEHAKAELAKYQAYLAGGGTRRRRRILSRKVLGNKEEIYRCLT